MDICYQNDIKIYSLSQSQTTNNEVCFNKYKYIKLIFVSFFKISSRKYLFKFLKYNQN